MKARLILFFLFSCSALIAQNKPSILQVYHINVVNVTDGTVKMNQSVILENGKIKTIEPFKSTDPKIPSSQRIDAKNKFMIPGLCDMHIHLEGAELVEDNKALLPVFLAYGITSVRDCASDLGEQVLQWRQEIRDNKLQGPTIFTAGLKLEGKNSVWKGDLEIENEKELKAMLDRLDSYKVDFIKITENTLKGDLFLESVKQAHSRGYKVSGHVPLDVSIAELVNAGLTSVEHADYLLRLGSDETSITKELRDGKINKAEAQSRYAREFDQQKAIMNYKEMGKAGLFVCPTLIGGRQLAYLDETDHSKDPFLPYLTKKFLSNYQWRIDRMANESATQRQQRKERYNFLLKQIPLIQQSGIRIIAGSDAAALNTYVYPAESFIQELEIFRDAGLTPLQILQAATINGAIFFGIEKTTGSIDTGKNADLVVLNENPLENITAVRTINSVIVRGEYHSRTDLDKMLDKAKKRKVELDSQR
ncbi:MAG TPA: amidohydrolase family protein [Chryseolinea sp.]